jgi:hexosaminidase
MKSTRMYHRDAETRRMPRRNKPQFGSSASISVSLCLCVTLFVFACSACADVSIIPRPVSLTQQAGVFTLTSDTRIVAEDTALGNSLADALNPATGFKLEVSPSDRAANVIRLKLDVSAGIPREGYRLESSSDSVTITASDRAGLFYGIQTLRQLLPPEIFGAYIVKRDWTIPGVRIEDHPRYRWRGLMLDCSRHFMPKEFVERYIDLLSIHKMNSFHWHLTDDQGWRIEIKQYPDLTNIGSWRKQTVLGHEGDVPERYDGIRYGGYYSQDDVREVVKFAAERFVNVVPEIEMPGHSSAAIAAYPDLGCGPPTEVWCNWGVNPNILNPSEHTIQFYQNVLGEVVQLFPSQFIHLGGDEVPLDLWHANPVIQARIKELHLKDEAALQRYMLHRMATFLESKGRRLIGWDEILDNELPKEAAVMSWHGVEYAKMAEADGHDAVLAPGSFTYFDHYQTRDTANEPLAIGGYLPLKKVYSFEPGDGEHLLGAQGQIWTEYIPHPPQVEYMAYPRACALAEVDWSPAEGKNLTDFNNRLAVHLKRLDQLGVNYRPPKAGD